MKLLFLALFLLSTSAFASVLPFSLPHMNGPDGVEQYSSADRPHTVFVVEAYFLGCPYCNDNAQNVNDLAYLFAGEPRVQVLDVGIDKNDSQYAEWIRRHEPNHPVLKDAKRELISKLGVSGYPSTFVITCKGDISLKATGVWSQKKSLEIKEAVEAALISCAGE